MGRIAERWLARQPVQYRKGAGRLFACKPADECRRAENPDDYHSGGLSRRSGNPYSRWRSAFGIAASCAIPPVFAPVRRDGRILVDGGLFNPVPFDLLFDDGRYCHRHRRCRHAGRTR
ncbi:patatin-like phospholipase family protein [Klebsiella pneumoniae subsp. pneumoniae]